MRASGLYIRFSLIIILCVWVGIVCAHIHTNVNSNTAGCPDNSVSDFYLLYYFNNIVNEKY